MIYSTLCHRLTSSPRVWMFKRECQSIVDSSNKYFRRIHIIPISLHGKNQCNQISIYVGSFYLLLTLYIITIIKCTVKSRFLKSSIFRTSRELEPTVVSSSQSNTAILTPISPTNFGFPWRFEKSEFQHS